MQISYTMNKENNINLKQKDEWCFTQKMMFTLTYETADYIVQT